MMHSADMEADAPKKMHALVLQFIALLTLGVLVSQPAAGQNELSGCYGGDPGQRIENCTRIIEQTSSNDDRVSAYIYRAQLYDGVGDWDKAINDYTASIGLNSDDPDVFFARGRAYANRGDIDQAINDYSSAIKADPKEIEYRMARGSACRRSGQTDGALADFGAAVGIEPTSAAPYFYRGEAFAARGETDRAIADFNKAIEIDSKSLVALIDRGDAFRTVGSYDKAIADYSSAIALNAEYSPAYVHRAEALINTHDFNSALADLDHAIKLDPENANARNIRGFIYSSKRQFDKAIAEHTAAIIADPLTAYRYSVRAWTYFKAGKRELALADAERAVRFAPFAASVYVTRGLILEAMGQKDKAIADLKKGLSAAPGIDEARQALIRLGVASQSLPQQNLPPRKLSAVRPAELNDGYTPGNAFGGNPAEEMTLAQTAGAGAPKFDDMAWLQGNLDRKDLTKTVFIRRDQTDVRSGPADLFAVMASANEGDRLSVTAQLEYKVKSGCGIDGASADAAWLEVQLADGGRGYIKSSDTINEEQRKLLSQQALVEKVVADYHDKNSGSLQEFAGIYDGLKDCKTSDEDNGNDPILRAMTFTNLLLKQVIWFEDDTMVSVRFISPEKQLRGRLAFWRNFDLSDGGTMKLYKITYDNGNSERIGFYRNLFVINPKITGNSINYQFANRCDQETAMVEWAKKIYDGQLAATANEK